MVVTVLQAVNWVIMTAITIITIIISICGGIPGIINIIKWSRERPLFRYVQDVITYGGFLQNGVPYDFIMLNGAIHNNGEKPLFPASFILQITFHDKELKLKSMPLVQEVFSQGTKGLIKLKSENPKDLLSVIKLEPKESIYGTLIFPYPKGMFIREDIHILTIICIDINKIEMTSSLELADQISSTSYYNPKYGLTINEEKDT